ncbi:MAG TPA: TonB family protein [Chitinophagaceae bacterium]|nr:TonB family protein [Chitinophagaceae bacterium]
MQPNQILAADLLDILFDGKNKDYGAYQLRKAYNNRMNLAMLLTLLIVAIPVLIFNLPAKKEFSLPPVFISDTIDLAPPPTLEPIIQPTAASSKQTRAVKTANSTTIAIVPDEDSKEADKPPVQRDLDNVKIGLLTQDGEPDAVVAPPGKGLLDGNGMQSTSAANGNGEATSTFIKPIEIESEYPGGPKAWSRFLNRMLGNYYPPEAFEKGIEGTVLIEFVVDIDGTISNIEAISGPEELREAAIRTIKKSGKWIPAIQNGRNVKTYKRQPITFVLQGE